jgi:hypothetical protein
MRTVLFLAATLVLVLAVRAPSFAGSKIPDQSLSIRRAFNTFVSRPDVLSLRNGPTLRGGTLMTDRILVTKGERITPMGLLPRDQTKGPIAKVTKFVWAKGTVSLGNGYSGVAGNFPVGTQISLEGLGNFTVTQTTNNPDQHVTLHASERAPRGSHLIIHNIGMDVPAHLVTKATK